MLLVLILLASACAFGQEVHISPTTKAEPGTSTTIRSDSWSAHGFDLKSMIARLYHVTAKRIEFPLALEDGKRYDFEVAAPEAKAEELLKQAIQAQFHIAIGHETRSQEAYIMTATKPPRAAADSTTSRLTIDDGQIKGVNTTMENVARAIEEWRDRFVVDETNLKGRYDFEGKDIAASGLTLTPGRRDIEFLVVKKL